MGNSECKCEQKSSLKKPIPQTFSYPGKKHLSFEDEILYYHNKARQENGLEPLIWDKALQTKAQDWVKFLVEKDQNGMCSIDGRNRHPGEGIRATPDEKEKYLPNNSGQNIYFGIDMESTEDGTIISYPIPPKKPVKSWYIECKDYKHEMDKDGIPVGWNSKNKPIGHFTQLMWKDTKKLGCAVYPCKGKINLKGVDYEPKGSVYVCNYDKGNIAGQFKEKTKWPVNCSDNFL